MLFKKNKTCFNVNLFLLVFIAICNPAFSGPPSQNATYVGSIVCNNCHSNLYTTWQNTVFPKIMKPAASAEFKNDADNNSKNDFEDGLILDGSHSFDSDYKSLNDIGFPAVLGKSNESYTIKIGNIIYNVDFVFGSSWKQIFGTKIGNSIYVLPIQYNVSAPKYLLFNPDRWFNMQNGIVSSPIYFSGDTPVSKGRQNDSWQNKCMGCHVTGLKSLSKNDQSEWLGEVGNEFSEYAITCEACHGPGSEHVASGYSQTDKKIVNPRNLDTNDLRLSVCGRCHSRGKSSSNIHDYPWDDTNNKPCLAGNSVSDFIVNHKQTWFDGNSKANYQQYQDFKLSIMSNKPRTGILCYDCHDPHGTNNEHLLKYTAKDNTLCLKCHEAVSGFVDDASVKAHTHHDVDPSKALSRCTRCHMSNIINSAEDYDIHSHTLESICPEKTLKFYMPNSCMISCHKNMTIDSVNYVNDNLSNWTQPADIAIARYLDDFAKTWWGDTLPTAQISTNNNSYSLGQNFTLELALANPVVRFVESKLVLIMLNPKGELRFFPTWASTFSGIDYTIPYFFNLQKTPVIPMTINDSTGTYYFGFAIMNPDASLSNPVFYSDFSFDSGSITSVKIK
jgi:predicted CXXCH cytochrome family protein